ncbi:MAG: DNA topoisomerase IB, partial [Lapillicoccus sp.]
MRLRRSVLTGPGLRRVRRGKGFTYRDDDGHPVDAETTQRVKALVIPPAWKDVWISPYPHGHIQAVGTDDAGRRQYLYHPAWRETRDRAKHERVRQLVP